jgi:serine/threonine protein phosphatase Stp1
MSFCITTFESAAWEQCSHAELGSCLEAQLKSHAEGLPAKVESWGWSIPGMASAHNQDSFLNWPERLIWAVADGVGGCMHGAPASRLVVKNLMRTPPPDSLEKHVGQVKRLLDEANSMLTGDCVMIGTAASTIMALLMHDGQAACLWAGDSRCYLLRKGVLYLCTRDHTVRQRKIDSKELTEHEAQRMVNGNVLTNAVGIRESFRLGIVRFALRMGDRFLVCSDGISNVLSPEAMSTHLCKASAQEAALSMFADLTRLEPRDDSTCMTVFVSKDL